MQPIYAGGNRVFCELPSGERICVDSNTLDATLYLLGERVEPHVVPLFRRFLTADSVVLDIGANFGLYTVIAAKLLGPRGRLYAFEPLPHAFGLLRRSVWANKFRDPSNVVLVNALVGEANGSGRLYYDLEELAGASLTASTRRCHSVDVKMVAIDEYLPADLKVDLVKIDVEGHEPEVLRGMARTIARSPNIRLFVEFFEPLLEEVGQDRLQFLAEIRRHGLDICKILDDGDLTLVEPGEDVRGEHYLLLTRTPQADMARDYFVIAMESLKYHDRTSSGAPVLLAAGVFTYDRRAFPETAHPVLCYGPYLALSPGRYEFQFVGDLVGEADLRFTHDFGAVLEHVRLDSLAAPIVIDIPRALINFEIVVSRTDTLQYLKLNEIRVRRSAPE